MIKSEHLHLVVGFLRLSEFRRFHRGVVEDSILLCHDDASSANRFPKFQKSVVPSKCPEPIPQ
jgi:hypothetical protein